jgi:hypothetical protein
MGVQLWQRPIPARFGTTIHGSHPPQPCGRLCRGLLQAYVYFRFGGEEWLRNGVACGAAPSGAGCQAWRVINPVQAGARERRLRRGRG